MINTMFNGRLARTMQPKQFVAPISLTKNCLLTVLDESFIYHGEEWYVMSVENEPSEAGILTYFKGSVGKRDMM